MSQEIKLIASFSGLKFLPSPLAIGSNSMNPKLVLHEDGVEYRVFLTNRITYSDIQKVDVFLFYKTTNLILSPRGSVFTFIGNLNDKARLIEVLKFLQHKGCPLSEKALNCMNAAT